MANKTYGDVAVAYGSTAINYEGGTDAVVTCVFYLKNNALTTISGADAGTYLIEDNFAAVKINDAVHEFNPFDLRYVKFNNNFITVNLG